jgi:hypothetical protein
MNQCRVILIETEQFGPEISHLIQRGWGNGYVIIPKGHALHGIDYNEINKSFDVNVHGGLTYSELIDEEFVENIKNLHSYDIGCWMIGFDTAHYGDSLQKWPRAKVLLEANSLLQQVNAIQDKCSDKISELINQVDKILNQ